MSSAYYSQKITEIENAKEKINGLKDSLDDCQSSVSKGEKIMENLTICGEPMDQGKVSEMGRALNDISDDFDSIISECNQLISKYRELYNSAKRAEEEAAAKAAQARRTNQR